MDAKYKEYEFYIKLNKSFDFQVIPLHMGDDFYFHYDYTMSEKYQHTQQKNLKLDRKNIATQLQFTMQKIWDDTKSQQCYDWSYFHQQSMNDSFKIV